ncbi:MAG: carbohydrate-binding domain-containing protein [Huintestinicola sp.]
MKTLPRFISAAASLLFIASVISGCSSNTASVISGLQSDADYSDAYEITLSDDLTDISLVGASFEKGILTISEGGDYLLSGTLSDGCICIDAPETDKVKLILNGVSVTSSDSPALMARSADKVVIELAEGSSNIFTDGSDYSLSEEDASADSCIYSECDLKIKGVGSLSVNGSSGHGIHSKDDIEIEAVSLTVNSAKDGIKGKDSVEISGGNITVISAGDGINSDNTDEGKGHISISGGNISVTSGGGASAAKKKAEGFFNFDRESVSDDEAQVSCKGIKAASDIMISGGEFTLDCCDDAIHSNGNISVSGGNFNIKTGDDGFHADNTLTLSGGICTVSESYEGLEGTEIILTDGQWSITSSDDGVNAAGGSDSESDNRRRQDMFAVNESNNIRISGGQLYINAGGDGIDSNGNVYMSGGEVYVDGPTNSGNGALDYNGVFEVTGGTVITAGSSGMAQTPSAQSAEYTLAVFFTSEIEGGTMISVQNAEGETIAKYSPTKKFSCITVTSPLLEANSTVTVLKNGEAICSTVLGSNITSINEKGEAVSSGYSAPGKGGRDHFGGGGFQKRESAPDMNGEPPAMPQGENMTDMPPFDGVAPPAPDMNSGTVTGNAQDV